MEQTSTILIVDDEPTGQATLEALLIAHGYRLEFANNGTSALAQAARLAPDLILLDVMMPGMDGFEVCRRLRADPMLSEVPVIMVTALDDRESRLEGIAAGADDFISKPFDRGELRARVHTITRLNRYRRLIDERAKFERLIELSPDGLLIVDEEGMICMVNPAMVNILHAESEQAIVNRDIQQFIIHEQSYLCTSCCTKVIADPYEVICMEITMCRLDGSKVPVEIHAGHAVWNEHPVAQMIARDITQRKQAEMENIQLVEKLAERERRLQYMVEKLIVSQEEERRRVAYELHDGLAQVASSTYQQLQTFATSHIPSNPREQERLNQVLESSRQVVREARHVIAGMRPTVLDDFGLASALRLEIDALREQGWDISFEELCNHTKRLPPAIETAFYRVGQEALTNIRKHAGKTRGRVSLSCSDHAIRLEVQDWGKGFHVQEKQETTSDGCQIGLLGMQERITLLDGTFHISSHIGEGTLLKAEVPFKETAKDEEPHDEVENSLSSVVEEKEHLVHIVIADDHDLSRAGVRSMLEGENDLHIVGEATNGVEALNLCQQLQPNLALLDVRMPEMDGLQATRAIKQTCPETSVIIVTMHENAEYLLAAIRAGAAGYMLKDTGRREFLAAIRKVLRGESFLNMELTQRLLQQMANETIIKEKSLLPEPLTPREHEVLKLLAQGKTNRLIAEDLVISPLTVKVHVQRILAKLDVSDRTQAAVRAIELGLVHT